MRDVRVAAAQITSKVGDIEGNLARHRDFVGQAATAGAEIVCFPELSLSGYPLKGDIPHDLAQPVDGSIGAEMARIADDFEITILAGILEKASSGALHNTHLIVVPKGRLETYRKTHVPTSEIARFRPGGELPVFGLSQAVMGVQICYDTHFPEVTTVQALAGAEIVFMPHASTGSETREEKRARWLRYVPARAYDNGVLP
jgi:predicted amidohydrolase